jgi:hypothetical protein
VEPCEVEERARDAVVAWVGFMARLVLWFEIGKEITRGV